MFNLLSFYIFFTAILIGFGIKYLIEFIGKKIDLKKYVYPIYLAIIMAGIVGYIIPTSLVYNNNPFNVMSYSLIFSLVVAFLGIKEKEILNREENDNNANFNLTDSIISVFGTIIFILYLISLFTFNLAFYSNLLLGELISLGGIFAFLISLFFVFSKNSIKFDLLSLLIIIIIGGIELYIFTQTNISSYFLPNVSYTLRSFLGFLGLFIGLYYLYTKKLINTTFILSFIIFYIIFKVML